MDYRQYTLTPAQFGSLCPHEPRLVKKLQAPITELITTTPAISLLYECVHTCIIGGMLEANGGSALAKTCVSKLAAFIQDPDQNRESPVWFVFPPRLIICVCPVKYIALLAMTKIVPSHPYLVAEYQDMILQSVGDQDISIRMRALDLVSAMVRLIHNLFNPAYSTVLPRSTKAISNPLSSNSSHILSPNRLRICVPPPNLSSNPVLVLSQPLT